MIVRGAVFAMGTRFEAVLQGPSPAALTAVLDEVLGEIEECDRRLSRFRADSVVSFINRHGAQRPVRLDQDLFDLFALCLEVHRVSRGAFDITVAPLMDALGFRPSGVRPSGVRSERQVPARADLVMGSEGILLERETASIAFARPGLAIDLGAVGKGFALDRAGEILRRAGKLVEGALLHGGTSTVLVVGRPPERVPWRVAVMAPGAPVAPDRTPPRLADVMLQAGEALSVSAQHGLTTWYRGVRVGHVLDGRTRAPVRHPISLAAVVCGSAASADAWSTALLAGGVRPHGLSVGVASLLLSSPGRCAPAPAQVDCDGRPGAFCLFDGCRDPHQPHQLVLT